MATLAALDMGDFVAATLADLGELKFQQIGQTLQHFEVFSKWFKKDRVQFDSGTQIQRNLMLSFDSTAASHVGLDESDQTGTPDVLVQLQVPWRFAQAGWSIWYKTDVLMNRGKSMIVNVLDVRRTQALIALVEELETRAWGAVPSTTNKTLPYGVQYWVVENATTGFFGALPGSHTAVGGVNPNTHTNFRNYTALYTSVTKTDLVAKLRTAHRACQFKSPVTVSDYRGGLGDRYRLYVNEATIASIEALGEAQNEGLLNDIAAMDGTMVFRRHPILYVPALDARTDGPVYMIDHTTFRPVCLKGDYLRESPAKQNANNRNQYQVFVDLTYNYVCEDRRRNAILSTAV